ncbi:SDR family NAD(P)-dependent oxidoreductase [Teredinibacter sp. KSP-S5-2]|uniref:SDR family NAD(P)-dependent oxidoreductase n=1 Tax=Teredinibacter sp. KSP-S5-2 TaxID=3034506 RepID=UPI002934C573|nr:SDR family NAD(P)-dependent oxidoreductase [Teredinibacter sp. KSP-S5-2]WNO11566.1 SDR family NAD(P)-dependent oxidoreductase [Teredinibacter sp. KSP-S5-2]
MTATKVLVTGGNGHVGNSLVKALCERGYDVHVTVRNPEEVAEEGILDGYDVTMFKADIRDRDAIKAAMEGVEGVFQVAALYHYDEQSLGEGIVENNTEGSQVVLSVAKELGVKRVVFTSSIAAIGFGGSEDAPLTEADWSDPQDPYIRSKLVSEQAAWEFAKENNLDMVTICPSIIMGPNFYKQTPSTVNASAFINNQLPFRFPIQCSVVDVRDVALAHILAFEKENASGRYLVPGTHISDLVDLLSELDEDMVVPERMLTLDEAIQLAEKSGTPIELVGQPYRYSDKKIREELGWEPRPITETLSATIDWIKDREM